MNIFMDYKLLNYCYYYLVMCIINIKDDIKKSLDK